MLIKNDHTLCITDIGLHALITKIRFDAGESIPLPSNWVYKSPEVLFSDNSPFFSQGADVYSWACTAYSVSYSPPSSLFLTKYALPQIYTGWPPLNPHQHLRGVAEIGMFGHRRIEQPVPEIGDDMWALLRACWKVDPEKRPTMSGVVEVLDEMALDFDVDV